MKTIHYIDDAKMRTMSATDIKENLPLYNDTYNPGVFQSNTSQQFWLSYNYSSLSNAENGNTSRHLADHSESSGVLGIEAIIIVVIVSLIPVSVIACMVFVISFNCLKRRESFWSTSSPNDVNCKKQISNRTRKHGIQLITDGENRVDHLVANSGDEDPMIDTPSSIYPADPFSSYLDHSKSSLTTPISNNSIITMTMRNNHLIVETEERIPCSLLNAEQIYSCNVGNFDKTCAQNEIHEFGPDDPFDQVDNFSEGHQLHADRYECTVCGQDNRTLFEPTTSRQADEEDQLVELFHKNILAFPAGNADADTDAAAVAISDTTMSVAAVSENARVDVDVECLNVSDSCYDYDRRRGIQRDWSTNTIHTQPNRISSSSSSSSFSKPTQSDYSYGNQCEYISVEYPFKKRSTLRKAHNFATGDRGIMVATTSSHETPISIHPFPFQDSVQRLTDCSFLELSDSST